MSAAEAAVIHTSKELEQRLERWADWARSPVIGSGTGAIGYLRERLDRAADSWELTDEIAITERAVARTKLSNKAYWRVIAKYYLGRLSYIEIAMDYHVSEASVRELLDNAMSCVAGHLESLEPVDTSGYVLQNVAV